MTRMTNSLLALAAATVASVACAQEPIRIGVLNDQSSGYADCQGRGWVLPAPMALEDSGGKAPARRIAVAFAHPQNQPDIGSVVARTWLDQDGADLIVD